MSESKTKYLTYPCKVMWAKVFEENRDMGNPDNDMGKKIIAHEGQYVLDMHITEQTKRQMVADGIPEQSMGHDMFKPAFQFADHEWVYRPKRMHLAPDTWKDDKGKRVVLGAPDVGDLNRPYEDENGYKRAAKHSFADGEIGNGSDLMVKLTKYGDGQGATIRLHSIGIQNLVERQVTEGVMF